ncbi:MAG: iron ABC transporter permease [Gloeomargarita sp. SKYG116]|nr:iron ABC transporter permease [Gloeomargarita sp. SKYG116]MCS7292524.1 iron ABC transporter permease [Gloeomargarita sp. SKYB120]MDW8178085.1 iron ABC transporter permease [Gloeomargarita sp. SKYBB_i_bin120]MDW8400415.1 iron ABC transporter permease [Gloeomargarita sp. SKYGB_i_bin116]
MKARPVAGLLGLTALLGGIGLLALRLGSVPLTTSQVVQALLRQGEELPQTILWELRLPRVLLGMAVGAALGTAGALMQGMLRNPLADPYLLGIAAGAGLAAVIPIVQGVALAWVPLVAWVGSVATALLVYALAWQPGQLSVTRLILAGVAVSAFLGSVTTILLLFADDRVQIALNWLVGSLNARGWEEVQAVALPIVMGLLAAWPWGRTLDILGLGDERAMSLGLSLTKVRLAVGLTATWLTAAAVSVSGLIGFVGLMVPHLVRLLGVQTYRWLIPWAAVMGALVLTTADTLARLGRIELPVGAMTALMGAPFFITLLYRRSGGA